MTAVDYHTRLAGIRYALGELRDTQQIADLPSHLVDQLDAAHHVAFTWLRHFGTVEAHLEPDRWTRPAVTSNDVDRVIDTQARVMAAMSDGDDWPVCVHLKRTPAQPAYVMLPIRRVDCERCLATVRRPPADEADRCDLCGDRGVTKFWPLRVAVAYWVVLGDTCQACAAAMHNPAAAA